MTATTADDRADSDADADASAVAQARPADRPWPARAWYAAVRAVIAGLLCGTGGFRATGTRRTAFAGGALLVSNHASFLDVFVLGSGYPAPINYVARSTLFLPVLGFLIRSVGGFPIQREGMGASGLKETLRRIRDGRIVLLFPEGTRSPDGALGALKPGISALAARARVPVIPAGLAGTYESWPRHRRFPRPYPLRVHYGTPILPEELAGLAPEAVTALIHRRLVDCVREARRGLARDLGLADAPADPALPPPEAPPNIPSGP